MLRFCFFQACPRPISSRNGGGCSRSRRYLECALPLRCPRPGLGHRERLRAGRGARRTPSGPAASSIGDDVAADVGRGAAVASIAPAHIARVGCCCMYSSRKFRSSLLSHPHSAYRGMARAHSTSTNILNTRTSKGRPKCIRDGVQGFLAARDHGYHVHTPSVGAHH
jgi:hypothetical protein